MTRTTAPVRTARAPGSRADIEESANNFSQTLWQLCGMKDGETDGATPREQRLTWESATWSEVFSK
jgi:hypothetical protein